MTLQAGIGDYLLYARHEQRVAKTTYHTYASWLHHFYHWVKNNGYPAPAIDVLKHASASPLSLL